jgi:uncharacterized SAM-dependent methyltransferase
VRRLLQPGGALLIGVDLKKGPQALHAAYNDRQGVTAAFYLNLFERLRRVEPVLDDFRIEMHMAAGARMKFAS